MRINKAGAKAYFDGSGEMKALSSPQVSTFDGYTEEAGVVFKTQGMSAIVLSGPCVDDMSGKKYPFKIYVLNKDSSYLGCCKKY